MELTRFQKALIVSALANALKEFEIDTNLKPSEGMKIMSLIVEEVEHLSGGEQNAFAAKEYQDAIRKVYDSMVNE